MSHDLTIQILNTMISLDGSASVESLWHRLDMFEEQRDLRKLVGSLSIKGYIVKRDNVYWVTDKGYVFAENGVEEFSTPERVVEDVGHDPDEEEDKEVVELIKEAFRPVTPMPLPSPIYIPPRPIYVPISVEAHPVEHKKPNWSLEGSGKLRGTLSRTTAIGRVGLALYNEPDNWFTIKMLKLLTGISYVNVQYAVSTLTSYSRKGKFPVNYAIVEGKGYERKMKWSDKYEYPFAEKLDSDMEIFELGKWQAIELEIQKLKEKKKEIECNIQELTILLRSRE